MCLGLYISADNLPSVMGRQISRVVRVQTSLDRWDRWVSHLGYSRHTHQTGVKTDQAAERTHGDKYN